MEDHEREVLIEARLAAEKAEPLAWWYLSFADPKRPEGTQWLGGCFVQAHGVGGAAKEAWDQGCNPGGEVAAFGPLPETFTGPREGYENRLLSKQEVEEANPDGSTA